MTPAPYWERILLGVYILCFAFLNMIALLISSFYRKRFNRPSPRTGFILSLFFATLYVVSLAIPYSSREIGARLLTGFLLCASIASATGSIMLYFTMRKIRK